MSPYVNIHTHHRQSIGIEMLSVQTPCTPDNGVCSLGVHPWRADSYAPQELNDVATAHVAAIGETGLDFACNASRDAQVALFEAQLRIAEQRNLPVVLHCVRAFDYVADMLRGFNLRGVVFHGFIGSRQQMQTAVQRGWLLSVGRRSLASPKTVEAIIDAPLSSLLAETDEDTCGIEEIYDRLAKLKAISTEQMREALYDNYKRIWIG